MVQIYFLSICFSLLGGIVLSAPYFKDRLPWAVSLREFIFNKKSLHIGLISSLLIVGILKIISVYKGDVVIVGDFFPALALLTSGFTMLIEYISERREPEKNFLEKLDSIFVKHSSVVGVAAIVAAILHFLFPGVLFL